MAAADYLPPMPVMLRDAGAFLRRELAPFPGRVNVMLRCMLTSAIVIVASMALEVPELALSLLLVFYVTQSNVVVTRLVGVMFIVGSTLAIGLSILLLKFTFDYPLLRIVIAGLLFFGTVYLMRVLKIGAAVPQRPLRGIPLLRLMTRLSDRKSRLMDGNTPDRVRCLAPRSALEHAARRGVTGIPTGLQAVDAEIDILGVIVSARSLHLQLDDVHGGVATPLQELLHCGRLKLVGSHVEPELADDMSQMVNLTLPRQLTLGPARILNVFLPADHLPNRFRLRTTHRPQLHSKNNGIAPRGVVPHSLDRRVGMDAAIPVGFTVDAHRREGRGKRGGGHDVLHGQRGVAIGEIA
jgi:hypothetical protein